jgi:hypothetical protein
MVINGSGQDPLTAQAAANPLAPSVGDVIYDSGRVASGLARSLLIADAPLGRGTCTVAVRAWARLASGVLVVSDWAAADFDIAGTPSTPGTQAAQPVFNPVSGGVDVTVTTPAGVSRGWLLRSDDGGSTFAVTAESPYAVDPSSVEILSDHRAPLAAAARYQVTFDTGAMSETGAPEPVGSGDTSTTITDWFLQCLADPTLNTRVEVAAPSGVSIDVPQESVVTEQPGLSLAATSPDLAARIQLKIRVRSRAERLAVEAILSSGETLRVTDIFGRSWLVAVVEGRSDTILRWRRLASETTGLRDAHEIQARFVEVTEP